MKKYLYILIVISFIFTSCEDKETEGISRITYYCDISIKGNSLQVMKVGDKYTESGFEAFENKEDVSKKVVIAGKVDSSKVGAYTLVYSVKNKDGFPKSVERKVLVVPTITSTLDVSGTYSGQREGKDLVKDGCTITKLADGVFSASDFFGGYYVSVTKIGAAYRLPTYFYLNTDNTYVSLSNNSPWGPWDVSEGTYTVDTKTLRHKLKVSSGTNYFVTLIRTN